MKFWKKEYNYKIIDDTVSEKELQEFLRKNYIHMDIVDNSTAWAAFAQYCGRKNGFNPTHSASFAYMVSMFIGGIGINAGTDAYIKEETVEKELLNTYNEINKQDTAEEKKELQFQCNYLQEGASEFYRGARENANMVGQLKRENKELKLQLEAFKDKLCELEASNAKQYDKRFHIEVSNDNTVRLIDHKESNDLISIGFKKHSDAADCSDALQYLCNLMNGLAEENEQLKKEYKIAIDEMVTDYKKLEKENEQLQKGLEKVKLLNESLGLFANE